MPSFTSLLTKLTTKILLIYVTFYINPSFDITRVPLNDSSALELQHLSNQKELLSMLMVYRTFAAVLPPHIFHRSLPGLVPATCLRDGPHSQVKHAVRTKQKFKAEELTWSPNLLYL
ncbi:hypothetical protein BDP27DRAFT_1377203 [Rhodocollybia butyracea]|uniref:Uncharacterized protein n=1 Tax=Rhodocollybia butyracea TaxID=206335 RepID=A0A9P5TVS8_9AGAR|nr:hypothetical protein BDP27DRAFT_1377203 [Rhodocollybia butyracea]